MRMPGRGNVWIVVAGAVASVLLGAWYLLGKRHRFAYWGEPVAAGAVARLENDGWRHETLSVDASTTLHGLVRRPRDPACGWVVFLPGNAGSVLEAFQPPLTALADARGCGIAVFAWRGFEPSNGVPSPAGLAADASAVWHAVRRRWASGSPMELWGYSLGTPLAVELAAELCRGQQPPDRLVLLSAAPRFELRPFGTWGRFQAADVYDCSDAAADVRCPVVQVHGDADAALSVAEAERLRDAFAVAIEWQLLAGATHVSYLDRFGAIVAPMPTPVR
jgi:alpha/beta superfamily hydrolase